MWYVCILFIIIYFLCYSQILLSSQNLIISVKKKQSLLPWSFLVSFSQKCMFPFPCVHCIWYLSDNTWDCSCSDLWCTSPPPSDLSTGWSNLIYSFISSISICTILSKKDLKKNRKKRERKLFLKEKRTLYNLIKMHKDIASERQFWGVVRLRLFPKAKRGAGPDPVH